jgi:hypothetical protein
MNSRRNILALIGLAPAAAAAGLKEAAARAGVSVTGIGGMLPRPSGLTEIGPEPANGPFNRSALRAVYRMFGLPAWEKERIRREARYVEHLDPDLASARSFSLSARVRMQADRNYARRLSAVGPALDEADASELFVKQHGDRMWF